MSYRLNWRETLIKVLPFTRKLCTIIGTMLMQCIILELLMVKCLSLTWYIIQEIFLSFSNVVILIYPHVASVSK